MWGPPRATAAGSSSPVDGSASASAYAAWPHAFRRGGPALRLGLFGLQRRHILCSVQLTDALESTPQVEVNSSLSRKASISTRDDSNITCKGFCTVAWNLQVDGLDGYMIFVTGDPVTLGCWESNMAILLTPSVESANLWTAEIKVPWGMHFKYNYFIREEKDSSSDIIWRPGPEYSLSIPLFGRKNHVIVVKDWWTRTKVIGLPSRYWGSWLMEAGFLEHQLAESGKRQGILKVHSVNDKRDGTSSLGEHIVLRLGNGTPSQGKRLSKDLSASVHAGATVTNKPEASKISISVHGRNQPVEEPWILESIVAAKKPGAAVEDKRDVRKLWKNEKPPAPLHGEMPATVKKKLDSSEISEDLSKGDWPVEEPWLFQYRVEAKEIEAPTKDKMEAKDLIRKLRKMEKYIVPLEEDKPTASQSSSRVILINSSVCTMQRIAVLEDGKLVELLLEPIKNNVQCDSIYLGVVTKLVPHMGGAFVDIGLSRPSLMGIKQNRDPFVYPHIVKEIKGDPANDSDDNGNLSIYYDDNDGDMTDDEFADEENDDDSSALSSENVNDHEGDMTFMTHSKADIVDGVDIEGVFNYDEEKDDENDDHLEDEYSEDLLPADQPGISNDLKTLSSVQQVLRERNNRSNGRGWSQVRRGTKVMVQVVKEGLGTKGPSLSPFPCLRSRFWILVSQSNKVGVSKKITGIERTQLKGITKLLRPPGFGLTARTVAAGHSLEELQKDLDRLLSTWKGITEHAQSSALAAEEGVEGALPVMLHRAMGQALSVVQDDFNEKVEKLVVDSPRTYHEVTSYLQEVAPELCSRVELYEKRTPIFDEYNIEEEIANILCRRVLLRNGGSLVIEQTEALVSIDVNGGHSMFGQGTSQENAILEVNLEAAKQIARELRLRDIGGIIVVDFIDMADDSNKRLVYEEMKKAVEMDRSAVRVSELSKLGLMEITRKRVRPSVSFMISEPCPCCLGAGRVEALDTAFSKIEHEICRRLAASGQKSDPGNPKLWPRFVLRVDHEMCAYLTSGKKTKLGLLSSSLKVWILLKIARGFARGAFELLPYSDEKGNYELNEASPSSKPKEAGSSNPKLSVFPIKKWMSRGKRVK